ncbi:MAG: tRNA glutamyl-Q(34) synthetase GluQRS [Thiothrix sp.]|nr:tRNA glutamyl-Q(34) synthetase GluQRS [Thiothrix sp.]HPE60543.1 tRNA glutamyl-Q(34) synthetase GluQRS [Thiolinea sp.]
MNYRGRFAPSPTGRLHFGSLLTATASYLEARSQGGIWLLRIEDLDTPRIRTETTGAIIRTLALHGFVWDEDITYQSRRLTYYRQALQTLKTRQLTYACTCSRKVLQQQARPGAYGLVYPGTCRRQQTVPDGRRHAIRIRVPARDIRFNDRIQGLFCQNLATELGDFVLRRADGIFAYQLAVVVDDARQGITHVVRGADLLDNTPRQYYLQEQLELPHPHYAHIPLACNAQGQKLSKQTFATALEPEQALDNLCQVWNALGQIPLEAAALDSVTAFWDHAIRHWEPCRITGKLRLAQAF